MSIDKTSDWSSSNKTDESTEIPQRIGRYRILRELGRGGFGTVYLAVDDRLQRNVAVKLSRRQYESREDVEAFLKEPRAAARLNHPHVASVYDSGQTETGHCYIVSRYVEGSTLKEKIANDRPGHEASAHLIAQIADALHEVHLQGMVHRDVKPANILLDKGGQPQLTDFGLALTEEDWGTGERRSGTLAYMSPEQLAGDSDLVDGRSDVFGLGVVLYELLTGDLPLKRSRQDLFSRDAAHEVKPPRQRDDTIPLVLEEICLKALSKERADRYQTCHDMAVALQRAVSPPRSNKLPVAIAVASAVSVMVIVALLRGWFSGPPSTPAPRGDSPPAGKSLQVASTAPSKLDVLVWNSDSKTRRRQPLFTDGAVPVRPGDKIRVEARLNGDTYVYVIWLGCQGEATPLYPWKPADWSSFPKEQSPVDAVSLPADSTAGWRVTGPSGAETILLLERKTPLPADIDLEQLFAEIPKPQSPLQSTQDMIYFADGRLVLKQLDRDRGIDTNEVSLDDPLLERQQQLYEKLRPHFEKITAVSFAHRAE